MRSINWIDDFWFGFPFTLIRNGGGFLQHKKTGGGIRRTSRVWIYEGYKLGEKINQM